MSDYDWMEDDNLSADEVRDRIFRLEKATLARPSGIFRQAGIMISVSSSKFQSGSPIAVERVVSTTSDKKFVADNDPALASA